MADDKVTIWGDGLKFGRKTANGELLIGNGEGFTMATLTAGSGASISNAAGAITISATGTGTSSVTASSPLASSGGSTPDISLSGTVGVANGGTGLGTLTANNVILGNGASAVQFVAPGTNGNLLQSNGTTWGSAAVPFGRQLLTTLTTTSGTVASYTSISTTAYTALACVLIGVSHSSVTGQGLLVELTENAGSSWLTAVLLTGSVASTGAVSGPLEIYNIKTTQNKIGFFVYVSTVFSITTTSTAAINGIRFRWQSGATFDAGSILIYGIP